MEPVALERGGGGGGRGRGREERERKKETGTSDLYCHWSPFTAGIYVAIGCIRSHLEFGLGYKLGACQIKGESLNQRTVTVQKRLGIMKLFF